MQSAFSFFVSFSCFFCRRGGGPLSKAMACDPLSTDRVSPGQRCLRQTVAPRRTNHEYYSSPPPFMSRRAADPSLNLGSLHKIASKTLCYISFARGPAPTPGLGLTSPCGYDIFERRSEACQSGDVCERRLRRMQRAKRSGSGRNPASEQRAKDFGHRNRT